MQSTEEEPELDDSVSVEDVTNIKGTESVGSMMIMHTCTYMYHIYVCHSKIKTSVWLTGITMRLAVYTLFMCVCACVCIYMCMCVCMPQIGCELYLHTCATQG